MRALLFSSSLLLATLLSAQTRVLITNVKVSEKEVEHAGNDVTIQLNDAEGSERRMIYAGNNITVESKVKVTTHDVRRSSVKDSAVNLTMEIDMVAGGQKDNKRVEKIFYADQARKSTVTQTFNFKEGITMRIVTLTFDVEIDG